MKTVTEINNFLSDKLFSLSDNYLISQFALAKGINVCTYFDNDISQESINCTFKDFIEWFEKGETKQDNQDLIVINGKEYEFIEDDWHICCANCDLGKPNMCRQSPRICSSDNRHDKREGYFKLKTQEKELKLIPNEFYYCECTNEEGDYYSFVFQKNNNLKEKTEAYHILNLTIDWYDEGESSVCDDKDIINLRLATPEEKQQLINAVEKQENKLWDEETKTFKDKPKDILVPESIKITDCKTDGYTLGLLFNNDIQILTYGKKSKAYLVGIKGLNAKYIQCKLIPTLFSEIKAGDIYIECGLNQLNPSCYHIKLHGKEYAKIYGKKDIQVCLDLPDKNQNVYKVVPII